MTLRRIRGPRSRSLRSATALCAQIPALLISVATGILVTRSSSEKDLGSDVAGQILDQRKAPLVAGVVIMAFGLVPALPTLPFLLIGGMFFFVGWTLRKAPNKAEREEAAMSAAAQAALPAGDTAAPRDAALDALALDPLELAIGFGLVPMVDQGAGGTLLQRVGTIRRQIASELGMVIPPVRIRDDVGLDSHEYVMRVRGTEVARGGVMPGHHLAMDPGDAMGQPRHPHDRTGLRPARRVGARERPRRGRGARLDRGRPRVRGRHAPHREHPRPARPSCSLARRPASCSTSSKEVNAAVVDEVVPDVLSVGEIQRVLQALLREGVSVRDLGAVVEAIGDKARLTRDVAMLAEYARQALGRTIVAPYLDSEGTLRAIALDPALEQEIAEALVQTADGEFLAMDPARAHGLVNMAAEQVDHALARGGRPVMLCSARVRRHLRRLFEQRLPQARRCAPTTRSSPVSALRPSVSWIRHRSAPARRHERCCPRRLVPIEEMDMDTTYDSDTKTFRGRSIEELLPKIRAELGPDAIVLRRREGLAGGVGGFFQKSYVEVEARPALPDEAARGAQRPCDGRGPVLARHPGAGRPGRALRGRARGRAGVRGRPRARGPDRRGHRRRPGRRRPLTARSRTARRSRRRLRPLPCPGT